MAVMAAQVVEANARNAANIILAAQLTEALAAAERSQAEALGNFEGLRKESASMAAAFFSANKENAAKNAELEGRHRCM